MFKLALMTRHSDEDKTKMTEYETKVTTILPFWKKEDFSVIK